MSRFVKLLVVAVVLVLLSNRAEVRADSKAEVPKAAPPKNAASSFIRVQRDAKDQPVALETATVRYVPANGGRGPVVDLIGVVHVGERPYYEALNKQFEQYDVLLYELVAPQGTRIPKGGKRDADNPIAMIQQLITKVLNLESQTVHIDYTKKNFVHADLSPTEMGEKMRQRGDSGLSLFFNIMSEMMRQQAFQELRGKASKEPELDVLTLLLDPNSSLKLKRLMAEQFTLLETPSGGLGNTLTTYLIADRNEAAIKVLKKEIAGGKKKIGIFYGAAHMPDFEKRLKDELGLKKENQEWLTAWDLKEKKGGQSLIELLGK